MIVLSFPLSLFSLLFGILFPLLGSTKLHFCRKSFVSFFKDFVVRQDAIHSIH